MQIIGYTESAEGAPFETVTAAGRGVQYPKATAAEISKAVELATRAFDAFRFATGSQKAAFLRAIAEEIENLGDELVKTVMAESGLPEGRVKGERGRTCGQLRLFADLVEEGSWVEAVIDHGDPGRQPAPKPDVRRMLVPLGPVVVFTASNFPLAFSTAGGDTASALAAGCPVIVKGHEAHPATNELVARAIQRAAGKTDMPEGVFSSLLGDHQTGQALVEHPAVAAVAFTGSHRGGKALFDMAHRRPKPIPVFAEMGSINPIVLLPQYVQRHAGPLAARLVGSVTLGAGQFCTNPGLILLPEAMEAPFVEALQQALASAAPQCMLNEKIFEAYLASLRNALGSGAGEVLFSPSENGPAAVRPTVAKTTAAAFVQNPLLHEEVFGPFTLLVTWRTEAELLGLVQALEGQLTATLFAEGEELLRQQKLLATLQEIAGRLIINGVPTGVEVCHAMHHGGPWPATTDSRFTSVGTGAIRRFARPVAFQDFPDELLPDELKEANPLGIRRLVDGQWT